MRLRFTGSREETMATRREFTAAVVGALGGGLGAGRAQAQAGRIPPSVVAGIQVGVASYTYRLFTFEKMAASLRSVGISSLELWGDGKAHPLHPMRQTEAEFKSVKALLDAAGITVSAYCTNFPNDVTTEYLDRAFRGCALLGAKVMTTSCEKPILDRLDAAAKAHRVKVGLHNHWNGDGWFVRAKKDPKANFEGPADWEEAYKGRSEYLAANLDIGHFSAAGLDPVAYFKTHHPRVVSIHVKDRGKDAEHKDVRFGQGGTPIAAFARALKEVRFAYAANLEYELEAEDPTEGVRDAFAYFKKALET
jgi:sugar phosphate isomerase/epimerase